MAPGERLPRSLLPHLVRTVEEAAVACARTVGRGDRHHSDQVAVEAMRSVLDGVPARGRVVIGEGERDRAPMLWSGEEFGAAGGEFGAAGGEFGAAGGEFGAAGGEFGAAPGESSPEEALPEVDIAVDPLEGTNLCATGEPGAITVLAASERGGLFRAPDLYMEKIVVGPAARDLLGDRVLLDRSPEENLAAVAAAEGLPPSALTVVVLDRPRHEELVAGLRRAGARVRLIGDGDLSAGLAAALPDSGVHAAMGVGGAPEGVIAAAALRGLGGGMLGRLVVRSDEDRRRVEETEVREPDRVLSLADLAPGPTLWFCAAGVTDGALVSGVRFGSGGEPESVEISTLVLTNDPPERLRSTRFRGCTLSARPPQRGAACEPR